MKNSFTNWYKSGSDNAEAVNELSEDEIASLLLDTQRIAIVGLSRNRHKDSHYVARYLQNKGYTIIPVNPGADEILGEKAYPDLAGIPEPVDVVDIFIPEEHIPTIVDQAIAIKPKAIWLQLGTGIHNDLHQHVKEHDIEFIQNRCMKVDHQFLIRDRNLANN